MLHTVIKRSVSPARVRCMKSRHNTASRLQMSTGRHIDQESSPARLCPDFLDKVYLLMRRTGKKKKKNIKIKKTIVSSNFYIIYVCIIIGIGARPHICRYTYKKVIAKL